MKKSLIVFILSFISIFTFSQEKAKSNEPKFSFGIHYINNIKNENYFTTNYSGVIGIDARYDLIKKEKYSFYGGITIDYFKEKKTKDYYSFDYKNTLMWNPNFGIDYDIFKSKLRPFFNFGFVFYTVKYDVKMLTPYFSDPLVVSNVTIKDNNATLSFQPGLRYKDKNWFLETSYKYVPEGRNVNIHLFTIGGGVIF